MTDLIRYHLDENVDPDIARALRRQGIDVTTTNEARLRTQPDENQWAYIHKESRVLITHDPDFLRMAENNEDHPGIAFCARNKRSLGQIIRKLILIHSVLTPQERRAKSNISNTP